MQIAKNDLSVFLNALIKELDPPNIWYPPVYKRVVIKVIISMHNGIQKSIKEGFCEIRSLAGDVAAGSACN
jgi:hypothetical protein